MEDDFQLLIISSQSGTIMRVVIEKIRLSNLEQIEDTLSNIR